MTRRGPLLTLAAAAVLGIGLLVINVSKEDEGAPAPAAAASAEVAAPATESPPPIAQFPQAQEYVGAAENGGITVSITVEGEQAVAYVCDDAAVEVWLTGSAVDGVVDLTSPSGAEMNGRLVGANIDGTLRIPGQAPNPFTAAPVSAAPASVDKLSGGDSDAF